MKELAGWAMVICALLVASYGMIQTLVVYREHMYSDKLGPSAYGLGGLLLVAVLLGLAGAYLIGYI